ncbi:hypothetical protein Godav_011091, partial [Gossypium davidsonii]|nr:hypothetical protein [Gossypium davidsonii]
MNHNEVKLNVHDSGTRVFLPANWVHLFTNGAVDRGSGATFAGGLFKGYNRIMIHTDNLEVIQALQDNLLVKSGIIVLKRVKRIMRIEKQWLIRYVPIKDNQVTDYLAKLNL